MPCASIIHVHLSVVGYDIIFILDKLCQRLFQEKEKLSTPNTNNQLSAFNIIVNINDHRSVIESIVCKIIDICNF